MCTSIPTQSHNHTHIPIMSAPKDRICGHMNGQHRLALLDYVVCYGNEKPSTIQESSLLMADVDETQITIEYKNVASSKPRQIVIAWENAPENEAIKVNEMSDVKAKLVAMAKYAAEKQGFASTRLTSIPPPSRFAYFEYMIMVVLALNAYNPAILRHMFAKDMVFQMLLTYIPGFLSRFYASYEKYALQVFVITVAIHFTEAVLVTVPILKKYRVPYPQCVAWIIMHLGEGFPLIMRLRKHAKAQE